MRVLYKHLRASLKSWDALFLEATDCATEVGRDRLISISPSAEGIEGIVTVWYWGKPEACVKCEYNLTGNVSGTCPECGAPA
jgi:hypothetical protein